MASRTSGATRSCSTIQYLDKCDDIIYGGTEQIAGDGTSAMTVGSVDAASAPADGPESRRYCRPVLPDLPPFPVGSPQSMPQARAETSRLSLKATALAG